MIDGATLNAAERLFGVRYTDAERAQMRDNLGEQVQQVFRRRAVKLPHALSPATLFDPRLPGFAMPAQSAMNIPRIWEVHSLHRSALELSAGRQPQVVRSAWTHRVAGALADLGRTMLAPFPTPRQGRVWDAQIDQLAERLCALVASNPALLLPVSEDQVVDVTLAFMFLAAQGGSVDALRSWGAGGRQS